MTEEKGSGTPGDVTRLLLAWGEGDAAAPQRLFALVYEQLRSLARGQLRRRGPDHSLSATGLVHEAYLKLEVSTRTAKRDWQKARAVLNRELAVR